MALEMERFDTSDTHLVFEGISDGIDNKFGLESVFYGMGFLAYIITISLFIDLFFTSVTSPILYSTFAPIRRRRRDLLSLFQPSHSNTLSPSLPNILNAHNSNTINNSSQNNPGNHSYDPMELGDAIFPRILILIDQLTNLLQD